MSSTPVYNREFSTHFRDRSVQLSIVAGADGSQNPLILGRAKYKLVIRRITVVITTSAAVAYLFRTSNGTPVILANVEASKDEGTYVYEYGESGYEIPAGEDLDLAMGGAGPAALVLVDAHEVPDGTARVPSEV